jgi:hypothetical protein
MKVKTAILALVVLTIASQGVSFAQALPAATQPGSRYELFTGFSKLRGDFGSNVHTADGWSAGLTTRLNRYLGVDTSLSGNYAPSDDGHSTNLHTLLAGPRLSIPIHMFTLSLNGGIGLARWQRAGYSKEGDNPPGHPIALAKSGGIGVDLRITRSFTYRLLQANYLGTNFMTGQNAMFTTGLIYGFGRR